MANWDGAQDQADGQNNAKTPLLVTFPPEKLKPKTKIYLFILTPRLAESIEGLNSSLAQSPGELYDSKALQEKWRTRDGKV